MIKIVTQIIVRRLVKKVIEKTGLRELGNLIGVAAIDLKKPWSNIKNQVRLRNIFRGIKKSRDENDIFKVLERAIRKSPNQKLKKYYQELKKLNKNIESLKNKRRDLLKKVYEKIKGKNEGNIGYKSEMYNTEEK